MVQRVVAAGLPLAGGFLTREIREGGRRVGFRVVDLRSGTEGDLSHVRRRGRPRVGRYGVDVAAFERVGLGALHDAMDRPGCVVIDEIGKMELFSTSFREVVMDVLDSPAPVLATIPIYRLPFVERLREREDVRLITVRPDNRDMLVEQIVGLLRQDTDRTA